MSVWTHIADHISAASAAPFKLRGQQAVGGGCINEAQVLDDGERRYFVKLNDVRLLTMFEAEADGLAAMAATATIRVPQPLCSGRSGDRAYLVMEYIPTAAGQSGSAALLGQQLAEMHRSSQAQHGWHRDNTIGSTPQPNPLTTDWVSFWREQRLGYQLELAAHNGYSGELQALGYKLLKRLDQLLDGHQPQASLLHGDLWSGNQATDQRGQPIIFDPACYYGDREADLAMTELFGGFPADFYAAYRQHWPLEAGYSERRTLYNLYHILNHLNLFGAGYQTQANTMLKRLVAITSAR